MKDDLKVKTIVVVDENLSLKDKSKCQTDLDNFLIPKNVMFSQPTLCSTVVSDAIPKNTVDVGQTVLPRKRKATRKCKTVMIVPDDSPIAHRTRLKYRNKNESVVRLPSAVSDDLSLSVHNLREVSIKNLRCVVTNIKTVAEKNGDGYRYGFSKWSAFLKSNQIHIGATLFFKYVKSSQLLILTKVVHKTTKKRGRA
ncbi:putative transcription factor B3-Domain family [Helianthus anomalus]